MLPERPPGRDLPTELYPSPQAYETERLGPVPAVRQQLSAGALLGGRFRIVRMLGQGGMGEVYEAVDVELGTHVALKTVRLEQAANESTLHRFRREILLARKIAHPNVCKVFELHVGGIGEPPVFLCMELLEGETLAVRLRRKGHLEEAVARGIVLQIAAGLGAAHAEGVVHRDLKSSNVMLVPVKGGGERAVVTDFGIAHAFGGVSDATATLDGPIGTPAYMAPEQVTGGEVTPATDLYCLGVLIYELTTGTLPFSGDTPAQVAYRRLGAVPPDPRISNPGLSKRWSRLVRWCLATDPAQRPQSAEAFRRALEGETRLPRQRSHRRPLAVGLALAVAAAVVPLAARFRHHAPPAVSARPVVAVMEGANLTGDSSLDWLATAFSEAFASSLEPTRGLRIVAPRVVGERQFSLGVATAPQLGTSDGPRRLADSVGASSLVELTIERDKPGSLRYRASVRSASRRRSASWDPTGVATAMVEQVGSPEQVEAMANRLVGALRSQLRWERGDFDTRSPFIPTHPLPADPEARRLYAEAIRRLVRYDRVEALFLVRSVLKREPGFGAALTLTSYDLSVFHIPLPIYDANLLDEGIGRIAELPSTSLERRWAEAFTPEAMEKGATPERVKSILTARPDDFELALQAVATSPDLVQQLAPLRALPPPLGTDPRIDMLEVQLRLSQEELTEALVAIDRGLAEARRREDRLLVSWFLSQRGVAEIKQGRTDEAATSFVEAEREAIAAGSSAFARMLRIHRAHWLGVAGRNGPAAQVYRQFLAELPGLDEGWRRSREGILRQLIELEGNLGHLDQLHTLLPELFALRKNHPDGPFPPGAEAMRIFDVRNLPTAAQRETAFHRAIDACGSRQGCTWFWSTWLAGELVEQGRAADASKLVSETGPIYDQFDQLAIYAMLMVDLGKAAEAYPSLRAKVRDDARMRGAVTSGEAWQARRALTICLLAMHELDEAARVVAEMARFHRVWDDVEGRAIAFSLEARVGLARGAVPPELPGLMRAQLADPLMSGFPRARAELGIELGRFLVATGKAREGRSLLSEAHRVLTARGELRTARLARAALDEQADARRLLAPPTTRRGSESGPTTPEPPGIRSRTTAGERHRPR